jgi:hypothetical protein
VCAVAVAQGCTDQRDLYVMSGPLLEVGGDFVPALGQTDGVNVSATAMLFDAEGNALSTKNFSTPNAANVPVGHGIFDVMLFNGTIFSPEDTNVDVDGVDFRGNSHIDTFEAVATEGTRINRLGTRGEDEFIPSNAMKVITSAVRREDVEGERSYFVKYKNGENGFDTPEDYVYSRMDMTPMALSYKAELVVTISKHSSSVYGASAALYGFVGSAFMASRLPSHFYVTHQLKLNSLDKTGDADDSGTIRSGLFVTFGPPLDVPDNKYEVYIVMALQNGQQMEWRRDVSDQIAPVIEQIKDYQSGAVTEIPLNIELDLTLDNVPYVPPVEGSIGIDGWEDDEVITVKIKS